MWSLLAPVPNANALEPHMQVVGGRGRRGQPLCAQYDQVCGKKLTITSEAVSEKQTSYLLPNFKCQRDAPSTLGPQFCFVWGVFDIFGNVSSLNTCSQMELGFSICELKVIVVSEQT